jgi:nicotinamidase-related amidase
METIEPIKPTPVAVSLDAKTSAVVVLALTAAGRDYFQDEKISKLLLDVGAFLEKARASGVQIIFTAPANLHGGRSAEVAEPLKRRQTEPVIRPDAYDKFVGGELQSLLAAKGVKDLVIFGAGANVAILYTATAAARNHGYNVIIPMDAVTTHGKYEEEYTYHQLSTLPGGVNKRFRFSSLSGITFQ